MKQTVILLLIFFSFTAAAQDVVPRACMVYEHRYRFGKPTEEGVLTEQRYYDRKGNMIKKQYYADNGTDRNYERFAYDDNSRLTQKSLFTKRNRMLKTYKYTYHSSGKILSIKNYDRKGRLVKKTEYTFPEQKEMWIIRRIYDENGLQSKTVNTSFDETGKRKAGVVLSPSGRIRFKYKIKHDDKGNEAQKVFFDSDDNYLYNYTREWNEQGKVSLKYLEKKYKIRFFYNTAGLLEREIYYNISNDEPMKLVRYEYFFR